MLILVFILQCGKWWWKIRLGGVVRRGGILREWLCCDWSPVCPCQAGAVGLHQPGPGAGLGRNLQQC